MSWWDKYKERHGTPVNERMISKFQYLIDNKFSKTASFQKVLIDDIDREVRILDDNAIKKNPNKKVILCKTSENINPGNYVFWKDKYWICVSNDLDNTTYSGGIIQFCNNNLNWSDDFNNYSYPCSIENKISARQEYSERQYINEHEEGMLIYVGFNETTNKIHHRQRFIFNGKVFETQVIDSVTWVYDNKGVIQISVKQVPLAEKEIPTPKITIPESNYAIKIDGLDRVEINTETVYSANVYLDGELTIENVSWSLQGENNSEIDEITGHFIAGNSENDIKVIATFFYLDSENNTIEVVEEKIVKVFDNSKWF